MFETIICPLAPIVKLSFRLSTIFIKKINIFFEWNIMNMVPSAAQNDLPSCNVDNWFIAAFSVRSVKK